MQPEIHSAALTSVPATGRLIRRVSTPRRYRQFQCGTRLQHSDRLGILLEPGPGD